MKRLIQGLSLGFMIGLIIGTMFGFNMSINEFEEHCIINLNGTIDKSWVTGEQICCPKDNGFCKTRHLIEYEQELKCQELGSLIEEED